MFGQSKRTPLSAWPPRDLSDSYIIIAPVGSGNYGYLHFLRKKAFYVFLKRTNLFLFVFFWENKKNFKKPSV